MEDSTSLPIDDVSSSRTEVYEALGNERRHRLLLISVNESLPIDVPELARLVAASERETSPQTVAEEQVEKVHVSLYHNHLPKLADAGLIDYDQTEGTVKAVADEIESVVE